MNKPIKELIQRLKEPDYQYYGCELSKDEADFAISALEKQIPKKPIEEQGISPRCPYCENANYLTNEDEEENSYCGNCGQRLEVEDE